MIVHSDLDSLKSQQAAFTIWNASGTAFPSLLTQIPSARLKFWERPIVLQCTTTYLSKKLHRAQQGTEIPFQECWGKDTLKKRLVQCNKQQIHIATTLPKCLQLRSCWDTHRNEEGRLLDRGPAACRTSQTWKRLTTEANKRCHSSERNQELQNLAWGKKVKNTQNTKWKDKFTVAGNGTEATWNYKSPAK